MAVDKKQGKSVELLECYKLLIKNFPKKKYFVSLAEIYRSLGDYEEAVLTLKEGLKYHPEYVVGRALLAQTYYQMGYFVQANHESHKIVESDPHNILALKIYTQSSLKLTRKPDDAERSGSEVARKKEVIDLLNRLLIKITRREGELCQPF